MIDGLFGANVAVAEWHTAELVKYACNAFHATKVAFANEIGRLGKQMGVDARRVMQLVCSDTKLNLSSYYLKPGGPFGGSCLPKDLRALANHGRTHGLDLPVLENLLTSNERHLRSLLGAIERTGMREVAILGISFKANTDDLRESPMVEVAQTLLGRGYTLRIYDPALNLAQLVGANRRLIDVKLPHIASLLTRDLAEAVGPRGLVLIAQRCAPLDQLARLLTGEHRVLDLNGWPELAGMESLYEGLCW